MIRILLAEDQNLVLGAMAALLRLEPDFDVVGAAPNGKDALALCEQLAPDIVLTDIEMPLMTGLELAAQLKERRLPARVIVVTTFGRSGYLRRALEAGVRGYLLKDAPVDALAAAIRAVHGGGRAIAPELALESWSGGEDPLTERERQVLRLAGEGRSSGEIARQVHLSEGTVRNYLSEAISKLNAANRVEAYRMARDAGWL
jgi:two-component system response regulator DesR